MALVRGMARAGARLRRAGALNRFPIAFGDTLSYLDAARDFRPTFERAFGYGAFLRAAAGGLLSLWLPVAAQAALAAALAVLTLSFEAPGWPAERRTALVLAFVLLLLLGHLPWQASFLMPDVFTGVLALALLLLSEHRAGMAVRERVLATARRRRT